MKLTIRPFDKQDLTALHGLLSDPEVMRYMEPPYTIDRTAAFLENAGLSDPPLVHAVKEEDGSFAGFVIWHEYNPDSMEIGWVLRKDLWGKGCASILTEQLITMTEAAGKNVILECDPNQPVSRHIAEKFGFSYIGMYKECMVYLLIPRIGNRLRLIEPKYEDMWFRQTMLEDPETMSYNHAWGGTIPFPEDKWKAWYSHWVIGQEDNHFYRFLQTEDGTFVGEAAYHLDEEQGIRLADVIIYAPYRGRGYGGQALDLLCAAAKENGADALYDDIALDNPAITLFLKHGFAEEYRTDTIIMLRKDL